MATDKEEQNQDEYYRQRFNTKLTPEEEKAYADWLAKEGKRAGRDMSSDDIDYDLRGAWKSGEAASENGHFPDTYKKPNHPTFSEESQYHGAKGDDGTEYRGGRWIADENGNYTAFEQSDTNAKHWPEWAIKDYLNRVEPGVKLQKRKESK